VNRPLLSPLASSLLAGLWLVGNDGHGDPREWSRGNGHE
jgi:hypothetical protein